MILKYIHFILLLLLIDVDAKNNEFFLRIKTILQNQL